MIRAAIYARHRSESQRPESIEDQISSCQKLGKIRGLLVVENQMYAD